ncbi:hypothetical protein GQ53DRAFT_835436 [Thozetella sp. PMI_491]|nr:hypothetical protein GQ53DRAFT_835436 [Thozetella sp. PMI_491]
MFKAISDRRAQKRQGGAPDPQPDYPNIHRRGCTVLYGKSGLTEGAIDIVFIHGINGSPQTTWMYRRGDDSYYWPWELQNFFGNIRVVTYGYDADIGIGLEKNLVRVQDLANNLIRDLCNIRDQPEIEHRPIIFICHSLGGLVVKKALVYAPQSQFSYERSIGSSVQGLVFFGTPHAGSLLHKDDRIRVLKLIARSATISLPPKLESALSVGADELFDMADDFHRLQSYRAGSWHMNTFFEQRETSGVGMVVERQSTRTGYPMESASGLDANHQNLVRYEGPDDYNFQVVRGTLKRMVASIRGPGYVDPSMSAVADHPHAGGDDASNSLEAEVSRLTVAEASQNNPPQSAPAPPATTSSHVPSALAQPPGSGVGVTANGFNQRAAVRWLAKAWASSKDTWDGTSWLEEPISRYKIIFESRFVGVQVDSHIVDGFSEMEEIEHSRPWLASIRRNTPDDETFPDDGPSDCHVLVFDCVSHTTPQTHIIAFDETTGISLAHGIFYNTSFSGSRSLDDKLGLVRVQGLNGRFGPVSRGILHSSFWFKDPNEADRFIELLRLRQKKADDYEVKRYHPKPPQQLLARRPDLSQSQAVRWLGRASGSAQDTWDGRSWLEEPVDRYKIVFQTTGVRAQLEWDSRDWMALAMDDDSEKYMPWVATRPGIESFPDEGPEDCRVIVFDCIHYSVPWLRVLVIDELKNVAMTHNVFYNTSFSAVRSIHDGNEGYVVVKGLTGRLGPASSGIFASRLWFQSSQGKYRIS